MSTHPLFLIVVFDALRPDMVTPELAPNLCQFMAEGVNFRNARTVFPSSTRTSAVALTTGSTPRRNGLVQNKYFDPNIFHNRIFEPNKTRHIEAGMAAYGGKLLTTPCLGDIAAEAGYTMATFLSGACGTSRTIDPSQGRGHINLGFKGWDDSCPTEFARKLVETHGPIPAPVQPNIEAIRVQTNMVIESIYLSINRTSRWSGFPIRIRPITMRASPRRTWRSQSAMWTPSSAVFSSGGVSLVCRTGCR